MSLAALRERCSDRQTAEELADSWSCAVFAYGRDRRVRTRYFRYQATYRLLPARDERGAWTLEVAVARVRSSRPRPRQIRGVRVRVPPGPRRPRSAGQNVWAVLEHAIDEAAGRFASVAALLPDGPLAERAQSTRGAVGACVADGAPPLRGRPGDRTRLAARRRGRRPRAPGRPAGDAGGRAGRHHRRGHRPPRGPAPRDRRPPRPRRAGGPPARRLDRARRRRRSCVSL